MRNVVVTGGAGFIGVNLVRHLLAETDLDVVVVDDFSRGGSRSAVAEHRSARLRVVEGDVRDQGLVDGLVASADAVVHLAARSHNDAALRDPVPAVHVNVLATVAVLEAVRRHGRRLHHVSTDEVYGDLEMDEPRRFTTTSPYAPSSPYSASKAAADHLVRAWVRSYGVNATISSSGNNYGPWQHVEKFVPRQVTNLLDGGRAKLYGSGENVRDWLHVEDHCAALLRILERGVAGETYLVGAECERSNREVLADVLDVLGKDWSDVDSVADRAGHDLRYAIDPASTHALGWRARRTDMGAAIPEVVDWYRRHEWWWRPEKICTERRYAETMQ